MSNGSNFPAPGTVLWAIDVELESDALRMGASTKPNTDFLRFADIKIGSRDGRIEGEDQDLFCIEPGMGVSLFLERMIPEGMVLMDASQGLKDKKLQRKVHWWGIDQGHPIPSGLVLLYDGHPPGHCTLTVERKMTVKAFLSLVAMVPFSPRGIEIYVPIY